MSARRDGPRSPLVEAAEALDEELQRVGALSREAQRLPLDTRKNLERTGERLAELARVDERIGPLLQRLLAAVSEIAARQQEDGARLEARAGELQRRRETYQRLLERYAALGAAAQELNQGLQALPRPRDAGGPHGVDADALERIRAEVSTLVASAAAMSEAARAEDFDELARDADGLRQALLAARNKLNLIAARAG